MKGVSNWPLSYFSCNMTDAVSSCDQKLIQLRTTNILPYYNPCFSSLCASLHRCLFIFFFFVLHCLPAIWLKELELLWWFHAFYFNTKASFFLFSISTFCLSLCPTKTTPILSKMGGRLAILICEKLRMLIRLREEGCHRDGKRFFCFWGRERENKRENSEYLDRLDRGKSNVYKSYKDNFFQKYL